jgi:amino acid transporter
MAGVEIDETRPASIATVEAKSASLRKELGLGDLVFTQIVFVVGSAWVGTAAKLGPASMVFWVLAILLYYLPQAAVVIQVNRIMPLEGGLYQWAKAAFNNFVGFLVAWNLWVFTIVVMSSFCLMVATNFSYLVGPGASWLTSTKWYSSLVSALLIGVLLALALVGLRVGKWVNNFGGVAQLLTYVALIGVPFVALLRGTLPVYRPLAFAMPTLSLLSLNIFGKLALGALSGFEYVAILAGETRNPSRTIGRSVMIAAPLIAIMFILGTSTVIAFVPRDQIDLISPIPQALTMGVRGLGFAAYVVPVLIVMLLARQLGALSIIFTGNTRLPMVAGWDGLLPTWFTRLHPRFRTPSNSIVFVGGVTLAFVLASLVGTGQQEAFQLLENAAGILYAMAYVALFAIPLLGAKRLAWRAPLWLRLASGAGLGVTVLYIVLSVFPIIDVPSWGTFAAKIITVVVGANLIGVAIFAGSKRKRARAAA